MTKEELTEILNSDKYEHFNVDEINKFYSVLDRLTTVIIKKDQQARMGALVTLEGMKNIEELLKRRREDGTL